MRSAHDLLSKRLFRLFLFFVVLFVSAEKSSGEDFTPTLPVYRMTLDPGHLAFLETYPYTDQFFPAVLEFEGREYDAEVRFRGKTTRGLPKKSWNIKYIRRGPRNWESTNLNAEYRDRSLIRNRLSMLLGEQIGLESPEGYFVSLFVNDVYRGVHHEIEDVNGGFFERRNYPEPELLLQSVGHGGRFAPFLHEEDFGRVYEIKDDREGALEEFHLNCMYFLHSDASTFQTSINQKVDVTNILRYYAHQIGITNYDGIDKNYYVARIGDGRYRMYPWDCDASFGVDWLGNWVPYFGTIDRISSVANNVLIARLLGVPEYRAAFLSILHTMGTTDLVQMTAVIDSLYASIEHDVLQDTFKVATNEEFFAERDSLYLYLARKAEALETVSGYRNPMLSEVRVSTSYLSDGGETVLFEMSAAHELSDAQIDLLYTLNDTLRPTSIALQDNGSDGDLVAGDGVYSREVDMSIYPPPVYYVGEGRLDGDMLFASPAPGWIHWTESLLSLPSIRSQEYAPESGSVEFVRLLDEGSGGARLVELRNTSGQPVDLNGSILRLDDGWLLSRLEDLPLLNPGESILIASNRNRVQSVPLSQIAENSFYGLSVGSDSLFLLDAGGGRIAAVNAEFELEEEVPGPVVINEINYNSSNQYDTGDWVELFVRADSVDLSGWVLMDDQTDQRWEIPASPPYTQDSYIILAQDTTLFREITDFEGILLGGFGFGLSNSSDQVRLYDNESILVDIVDYRDSSPWPDEPDGSGATLELVHPDLPNFASENWRASLPEFPYGTPGRCNSVFPDTTEPPPPPPPPPVELPERWDIMGLSPIPFNTRLRILFSAPEAGSVEIDVFNVLGQHVGTIQRAITAPGLVPIFWDGSFNRVPVASGLYFLVVREPVQLPARKAILLR